MADVVMDILILLFSFSWMVTIIGVQAKEYENSTGGSVGGLVVLVLWTIFTSIFIMSILSLNGVVG